MLHEKGCRSMTYTLFPVDVSIGRSCVNVNESFYILDHTDIFRQAGQNNANLNDIQTLYGA